MLKIRYYTTNLGLFLSCGNRYGYYINNYRFNDEDLKQTHSKDWFTFKGEGISSIKELKRGGKVNYRYEIKDEEDISEKTPEILTREDVGYKLDEDNDEWWTNDSMSKYRSLYKEVYDQEEDSWEDIEFEVEDLGYVEISDINNVSRVVYNYDSDSTGKVMDLSSVVTYSDLDEMLIPGFALHDRPCSLSSTQTYKIVRNYIKDNINPKNATITSDYDFCFNVKKKIKIKPYILRSEKKKKNGRGYAKPKITQKSIKYKESEVFEMTHSGDKYRGYTPIAGFCGDSLQGLMDNINSYLEELMCYINTEVEECDHCSGTGHIVQESFKINERGGN